MNKKSEAYYIYKAEQAKGVFPYFDSEEIEQIAYDLLDDQLSSEALFVLEEGLKMHPNDERITKLKVLILIHCQRIDEERMLFAPFASDGTFTTQALLFAFDVVAGKSRSALRQLLTKVRRNEIDLLDFVNVVDDMWMEIPDDAKIDYLVSAAKIPTDKAEALARIGAMLMDLHLYSDAITALDKSLDIDAYDILTWQDLARCTLELYEIDKCKEACDFGLAIDPKNPLLHFVKGYVAFAEDADYKTTIESLNVFKDYLENNVECDKSFLFSDNSELQIAITYDILGKSYFRSDEIDKAIEMFEKFSARVPNDHEALFQISMCYLDKGDLPKALEAIDKALSVKRRSTSYLALKTSILASMHCFEEAIETLDKMIKIKPTDKKFILAKAELALGIRKFDIADQAFRKLLSLKPRESTTKSLMRQYFDSIGDTEALNQLDNY